MIARFTEELGKFLKLETKAEPWLHIAFQYSGTGNIYAAVYIWDTRVILEIKYKYLSDAEVNEFKTLRNNAKRAVDNHAALLITKDTINSTRGMDKRVSTPPWFVKNLVKYCNIAGVTMEGQTPKTTQNASKPAQQTAKSVQNADKPADKSATSVDCDKILKAISNFKYHTNDGDVKDYYYDITHVTTVEPNHVTVHVEGKGYGDNHGNTETYTLKPEERYTDWKFLPGIGAGRIAVTRYRYGSPEQQLANYIIKNFGVQKVTIDKYLD